MSVLGENVQAMDYITINQRGVRRNLIDSDYNVLITVMKTNDLHKVHSIVE